MAISIRSRSRSRSPTLIYQKRDLDILGDFEERDNFDSISGSIPTFNTDFTAAIAGLVVGMATANDLGKTEEPKSGLEACIPRNEQPGYMSGSAVTPPTN